MAASASHPSDEVETSDQPAGSNWIPTDSHGFLKPSDVVETSDQPSGSTWILTESHEYLKNVLSYLPAVQLFKCARYVIKV